VSSQNDKKVSSHNDNKVIYIQNDSNVTSVPLFDGLVRDCITMEVRGAGIVGLLQSVDFPKFAGENSKGLPAAEERKQSQESFIKIFEKKIWMNYKSSRPSIQASSGKAQ